MPVLKAVQHRKFHGDKFMLSSNQCLQPFVQKMEVVGEEISFY